jgi:hypothetical protein
MIGSAADSLLLVSDFTADAFSGTLQNPSRRVHGYLMINFFRCLTGQIDRHAPSLNSRTWLLCLSVSRSVEITIQFLRQQLHAAKLIVGTGYTLDQPCYISR